MRRISVLAALLAVASVVALQGRGGPAPVYACTGGVGGLDDFVPESHAIALVEAVSVGSAQNLAPTLTPTPSSTVPAPFVNPQGTPLPTRTPPTVQLAGIGARLRITRVIEGELPGIVDIDVQDRQWIEIALRRAAANPNSIVPCPLDFLTERYSAGRTYIVFLRQHDVDDSWTTYVKLPIQAEQVILDSARVQDLRVSGPVRRAYFGALAAERSPDQWAEGNPNYPGGESWLLSSRQLPLESFIKAVEGIISGDAYASAPVPTAAVPTVVAPAVSPTIASPPTATIRPPDTGSGGLRP